MICLLSPPWLGGAEADWLVDSSENKKGLAKEGTGFGCGRSEHGIPPGGGSDLTTQ